MKSRQMALCGLLCALAVVVMILAGSIGIGTFAGPVLAMAVLLPVLEEFGSFCTREPKYLPFRLTTSPPVPVDGVRDVITGGFCKLFVTKMIAKVIVIQIKR